MRGSRALHRLPFAGFEVHRAVRSIRPTRSRAGRIVARPAGTGCTAKTPPVFAGGACHTWAEGKKLALAVVFRGVERRLDVGELDLRCRRSRRRGAAVGLAPLDGTGGRATLTFGERGASDANTKGDRGRGGKNHGLHRSSP
jgi:hypothetical protein